MTLPATTGDLILADQYNQIHGLMNSVMGQGELGYGLSLLLSAPITDQNTLTAQAWQNLQVDLDTANQHITNTVTNITSIVTGTTVVSAARIGEFWDAVQFIVENRYQCHPQQYFKDPVTGEDWNTTNGTSSRTANWGLSPTVSITHEVNVVWASAAVRSYFFNSGGVLEWRPYHTNTAMTPNTSLNDLDIEWASFINHVQGLGGWDYDHTHYRSGDSTATTYSSGTLRINIVADQETDSSIRFVCTFTNVETPQLIVTPSTQYYNILYPSSAPASETFTIQNLSTEPAQINRINFTNPQGVQHTADVSQFGGYLAGQTNFTSTSSAPTLTKQYIIDNKSQTARYKNYEEYATVTANFQSYNTVTNVLTISNPSGAIGPGWAITGGGFTNQSVGSVLTNNTLTVSADPTPVTGNPPITFTNNIVPLQKLTVSGNNKIQAGWILSSDPTGFTLDQTVIQVQSNTEESTVLIVSGNPTTPLILDQAITFTSPANDIELFVDNYDGIIPGFVVSGNGYDGRQTVLGLLTAPQRLRMSDYPPSNPEFGQGITFTDTSPIGVIPANSSIQFSIDYSQTRNTPSELSAQMAIDATLGGASVIKTINNPIVISQAPAENPNNNFNPVGGEGETAPGAVTDSGSSSGSNWDWLPVVVFLFTGWFW